MRDQRRFLDQTTSSGHTFAHVAIPDHSQPGFCKASAKDRTRSSSSSFGFILCLVSQSARLHAGKPFSALPRERREAHGAARSRRDSPSVPRPLRTLLTTSTPHSCPSQSRRSTRICRSILHCSITLLHRAIPHLERLLRFRPVLCHPTAAWPPDGLQSLDVT